MATNFPTSLQDLDATRGAAGNKLNSPDHITHHQTNDDTVEALQTKVGIDSSAVTQVVSNYSWWILLISVLTVGITEEILFRGYPLERLQEITGNKWISGFISLIFFVVEVANAIVSVWKVILFPS